MTLSQLLKLRRKDLGFRLYQISDATGLSLGYLSDLENGRLWNPTIGTMIKLCEVYSVTMKEICEACLISYYEGVKKGIKKK